MKIDIARALEEDKKIVKTLFTFYIYDLLPFHHNEKIIRIHSDKNSKNNNNNANIDDDVFEQFNIWWKNPESIFPFLIKADNRPIGFFIISTSPFTHPDVNYRLRDFFIINKYRKKNIGEQVATMIFKEFPGIWELGWLKQNSAAESFWKKIVIKNCDSYKNWEYYINQDCHTPGLFFDMR